VVPAVILLRLKLKLCYMPPLLPKGHFLRELLPKLLIIVAVVVLLTALEKCGVIRRW
jgi:hypothetical protein